MSAANVARAMQLSPPTVHEMLRRLERRRLHHARRGQARSPSPTAGREHAEGIVRRHRLIERFLTDVLGIPWDEVHEEAERLEHAMSPVLEERMMAAIGDATTCPHGHPIEVGQRHEGVPLADVEVGATRPRPALRERGRGPPALPQGVRRRAGHDGHAGREHERGGRRRRRTAAQRVALTASVAETVSVAADPSPPPRTALPEQLVHRARTATGADARAASAAHDAQLGRELGEHVEVRVLRPDREVVRERGRGDDRVHRARRAGPGRAPRRAARRAGPATFSSKGTGTKLPARARVSSRHLARRRRPVRGGRRSAVRSASRPTSGPRRRARGPASGSCSPARRCSCRRGTRRSRHHVVGREPGVVVVRVRRPRRACARGRRSRAGRRG